MKLVTSILGIVGNVGNLDRICGGREGGRGIFQYGRHSDYKDCYWKNEAASMSILYSDLAMHLLPSVKHGVVPHLLHGARIAPVIV